MVSGLRRSTPRFRPNSRKENMAQRCGAGIPTGAVTCARSSRYDRNWSNWRRGSRVYGERRPRLALALTKSSGMQSSGWSRSILLPTGAPNKSGDTCTNTGFLIIKLHDQNFPSIGCTHCTRAIQSGEDARAGRWSGFAKTECGLHVIEPTPPTDAAE